MATVLALLVAVDPFGLGRVWPRRPAVAGITLSALVIATLVAEPVLDALDLSAEGFWLAAGIVLLVPASSRLLGGATRDVAGPAGLMVAMALATRDGRAVTLVASLVTGAAVLAASYLPAGRWTAPLERVVGALMVVVAVDLIRDGIVAV